MPTKIVSVEAAEHYTWGGPQNADCEAWHLVKTSTLSIIKERMPPGTSEARHLHRHARQFFFVLEGELTMEVEHHEFKLRVGEGLEIGPGQQHQVINRGTMAAQFIVTSQPPSHGDKIPA